MWAPGGCSLPLHTSGDRHTLVATTHTDRQTDAGLFSLSVWHTGVCAWDLTLTSVCSRAGACHGSTRKCNNQTTVLTHLHSITDTLHTTVDALCCAVLFVPDAMPDAAQTTIFRNFRIYGLPAPEVICSDNAAWVPDRTLNGSPPPHTHMHGHSSIHPLIRQVWRLPSIEDGPPPLPAQRKHKHTPAAAAEGTVTSDSWSSPHRRSVARRTMPWMDAIVCDPPYGEKEEEECRSAWMCVCCLCRHSCRCASGGPSEEEQEAPQGEGQGGRPHVSEPRGRNERQAGYPQINRSRIRPQYCVCVVCQWRWGQHSRLVRRAGGELHHRQVNTHTHPCHSTSVTARSLCLSVWVCRDLMYFASVALVDGGRLVFLLPVELRE